MLKEDFHLSYQQVFFDDGHVWMIPDSSTSGKVWLFKAEVLPNRWCKARVLINKILLDTSIIIQDKGIFLLGNTRANELKIYFFKDLSHEYISTGVLKLSNVFLARNAVRPIYIRN